MALGGPKVPYTPQRDWTPHAVTPEPRGWVLAVAVAALASLVSLVLYSLATLPEAQSEQVAYFITNPTGSPPLRAANITFDRSGMLAFYWHTNDTQTVNLSVVGPQGATVYWKQGGSGSGTITVVRGERYKFEAIELGTPRAEWVEVYGMLRFSAPFL